MMLRAHGYRSSADAGRGADQPGISSALLTCARCGGPLDRATQRLDGEYDLVCRECYLLTATEGAAGPHFIGQFASGVSRF